MMQKAPNKRYQTAGEVADVLANWLATRGKGVTGDSAMGSSGRIAMAAHVARQLAEESRERGSVATQTATDEDQLKEPSDRDTAISRAQAETVKSSASQPQLLSEELGLAKMDEEPAGAASSPATRAIKTAAEPAESEEEKGRRISRLQKELTPIYPSDEYLLRGARVPVEQHLPRADASPEETIPAWVWWAVGGGLALLLLVVVVLLMAA
jgi:hypothetical protein